MHIITCHLFKGIMKKWQTLILIHLENMIKQTHILIRQVKIFLSTQEEQQEDLLGNQTKNKKHHLEKRAKELDLRKKMLKGCIKNYLKDTSSLKKDIMTCLKLEMENCILKVWTNP